MTDIAAPLTSFSRLVFEFVAGSGRISARGSSREGSACALVPGTEGRRRKRELRRLVRVSPAGNLPTPPLHRFFLLEHQRDDDSVRPTRGCSREEAERRGRQEEELELRRQLHFPSFSLILGGAISLQFGSESEHRIGRKKELVEAVCVRNRKTTPEKMTDIAAPLTSFSRLVFEFVAGSGRISARWSSREGSACALVPGTEGRRRKRELRRLVRVSPAGNLPTPPLHRFFLSFYLVISC
ncbi:hypothetical protein LXL04_005586 [Taraxacum kok-saghyz]